MTNLEKLEEQRGIVKHHFRDDRDFSWSGASINFHPRVGNVGVRFDMQDDGKVQPYRMREKSGVAIAEQRLALIDIDHISETFFAIVREFGSADQIN
jgi:hypothetical protein